MSQLVHFDVKVTPNQQIDALIKLPNERRGVVQGIVIDACDRPVKNAVVKLYENGKPCGEKSCDLIPITHEFTDECGQFLFGPLCADKTYTLKVWVNDVCQSYAKLEGKACGGCVEAKPCCAYEDEPPRGKDCGCPEQRGGRHDCGDGKPDYDDCSCKKEESPEGKCKKPCSEIIRCD